MRLFFKKLTKLLDLSADFYKERISIGNLKNQKDSKIIIKKNLHFLFTWYKNEWKEHNFQ